MQLLLLYCDFSAYKAGLITTDENSISLNAKDEQTGDAFNELIDKLLLEI